MCETVLEEAQKIVEPILNDTCHNERFSLCLIVILSNHFLFFYKEKGNRNQMLCYIFECRC